MGDPRVPDPLQAARDNGCGINKFGIVWFKFTEFWHQRVGTPPWPKNRFLKVEDRFPTYFRERPVWSVKKCPPPQMSLRNPKLGDAGARPAPKALAIWR